MNEQEIVEVKQQGEYNAEKRAYMTFFPEKPVLARVVQFVVNTIDNGPNQSWHELQALVCYEETGAFEALSLWQIRSTKRAVQS